MENAFVKITIYFFVPHAMMFTNKCHLCKITEFYKDQGCPNDRQSFQICRPSDLGYLENCFETMEKRFMGNAFVKIAIYIFVPHIMTFTNKCHLCKVTKSYEGQECRNHNAAKPQNFTMIKDAKITKLSNIQTVNSILVVTSYHTMAIMRIVLKKRKKD